MLPLFFLISWAVCGAMFCFFVLIFCFLARHDFLSRHNFYYLINLRDCLFFNYLSLFYFNCALFFKETNTHMREERYSYIKTHHKLHLKVTVTFRVYLVEGVKKQKDGK